MKKLFFVEMTDTFGGEANYGWVNRFMVTAASSLGAIRKVTKKPAIMLKSIMMRGMQYGITCRVLVSAILSLIRMVASQNTITELKHYEASILSSHNR